MRVEILQHLAPQVVDRAVRFVGDDDVEGLDRDRRVVGDRLGRLEQILQPGGGDFVVLSREFAAFQHRIQPLDGADGDARSGVQRVRSQMLHDVFLAELVVVVGRSVLVELLLRLPAEVAAVHQEQHPPRAGELDQAVDKGNRRVGLAAAGGHLNEGARLVGGERGFEIADRAHLRRPQAGFDERREVAHASQESRWGEFRDGRGCGAARRQRGCRRNQVQPVAQRIGPMKRKGRACARLGVETVGEMGFDAGGLVGERQRTIPGGQFVGQTLGVARRLGLDARERDAFFLRFDHAGRSSVDVEQIVGKAVAGLQRKFADRHAARGVDVGFAHGLHRPAGGCKQPVDLGAGAFFRLIRHVVSPQRERIPPLTCAGRSRGPIRPNGPDAGEPARSSGELAARTSGFPSVRCAAVHTRRRSRGSLCPGSSAALCRRAAAFRQRETIIARSCR